MYKLHSCEVCGKLVTTSWFAITGDRRLKCGACCNPPRPEQGPFVAINHDPGDEDASCQPPRVEPSSEEHDGYSSVRSADP